MDKPVYTVEWFRDKYYICRNGKMIDLDGYSTRAYAEKNLKEMLKNELPTKTN